MVLLCKKDQSDARYALLIGGKMITVWRAIIILQRESTGHGLIPVSMANHRKPISNEESFYEILQSMRRYSERARPSG